MCFGVNDKNPISLIEQRNARNSRKIVLQFSKHRRHISFAFFVFFVVIQYRFYHSLMNPGLMSKILR